MEESKAGKVSELIRIFCNICSKLTPSSQRCRAKLSDIFIWNPKFLHCYILCEKDCSINLIVRLARARNSVSSTKHNFSNYAVYRVTNLDNLFALTISAKRSLVFLIPFINFG